LSTLTIEVKQVKQGTGAGTYAYIYAAYLRAGPNLDVQIPTNADDGYWESDESAFNNNGAVWIAGSAVGFTYKTFLRFTGVTVSGTVDTAYLTGYFEIAFNWLMPLLTKIKADDQDNPTVVGSAADGESRVLTNAGVDFDASSSPGSNQWFQFPEIKTVIQELVDSYTIENDAIQIIWIDDGGAGVKFVRCMTRDHNSAEATWLHIEYTPAGPTPGWNKIVFTSEPPTANAWNQLKQDAGTGWKKLWYDSD